MSTNRKDLIVSAACGMMIVVFVFYASAEQGFTVIHRLCNGFFVAGGMLGGAGLILYCANKGAFNLFGYGGSYALNLIMPFITRNPWNGDRDRETYYDYCVRKSEEPHKPVGHLLIVGGGYLIISAILLIVHWVM